MSSAAKAAAADHGRQELVKYFAGSGLAAREESLNAGIVEQAAGDVRFLDAGVKDLTVTSVVIDGDHATVTASATVWLDVAQVQADGTQVVAHPQNAKLYTLSLERMAGRWYVVDEFSKLHRAANHRSPIDEAPGNAAPVRWSRPTRWGRGRRSHGLAGGTREAIIGPRVG